ncbi:MAG: PH domain-containing protein [Cellulomonadaceae bacterium]
MTAPPPMILRPPHQRLEHRAVWWWTLRAVTGQGLLVAAVGFAYWRWEAARPWVIVPLVLLVAWTVVKVLVEPWWRYRVHRWETTDEAVYGLSGWLVREWRVAPISRIQTVDAVRGPYEQLMGLATLRVTTASSQGAIDIVGLDKDVAAQVAERLTTITERTPGDAT